MSKYVKNAISTELASRYTELDSAVWVEILGVDGLMTNSLRRDLKKNKMRLEVVKNALFKRAVAGRKLTSLADRLKGPSAVITGGEGAIAIAKVIRPWFDKLPGLKVRGAIMEGELVDEGRLKELDKLPTKRDLQGMVAGAALSPGAKLASAIRAPGANIAACIKAIADKLEKGEAIAAVSA